MRIPSREWRLQSVPNTGTLQRAREGRDLDKDARYYEDEADFSRASRRQNTEMQYTPSQRQIAGDEATFQTARNTILTPAWDTLRCDTPLDSRRERVPMYQLPAPRHAMDDDGIRRDEEPRCERFERRPSAVESKDIRKHSDPSELYLYKLPTLL